MSSSEELCSTIFDSLPVGVMVANLDGSHFFVNRSAASMTGYSVQELMGGIWLVHPDDTEASAILIRALRDGSSRIDYETRLVRKDGSVFWVSISWNPVKDDTGKVTRLCTVLTDISDRKDTQLALDEASERYRLLAENSSDILSEWDLEGNVVIVSSSVRQLGYDPAEIVGKSVFGLVPSRDRATSEARLRRLLSNHQPLRHEVRVLAKDGSLRWLEAQVDLVTENGVPVRVYAVHRDITERKAAEEELRQLNERFRAMAENSGDTFWEMMPDSTVTYVSSGLRRIGYEPDEWVGHKLTEFLPQEQVPLYAERLQNGVRDQQPALHEFRLQSRDGSEVWVEVMVNYVVSAGELLRLHGVARNVTERKRMENALRDSEERYRTLSSNAIEGVMIHCDGVILDANQAFANLAGVDDPLDLVGKRLFDVVPHTPESWERIREHMRTRATDAYDVELIGRDGQITPAETSGRDFVYRGRTARLVSLRNITDRKAAEEELRNVNERYRMLAENATDLLWSLDLEGTITYVSPAVRQLGYEPEDWIGHHPFEFIAPEEHAPFTDRMADDVISNLRPEAHPLHIRRKDGSLAWLEVMRDITKVDGVTVGVQGVARDITLRVEAEEQLQKLNERYREMAENSADTFWEMAPDGTFTYVSPALRRIGYEPEEWVGHTILEFLPPGDITAFGERLAMHSADPQPALYEFRVLDKQGSDVWTEAMVNYVFSEGKLVRTHGVARNITERKAMEEALRESEQRYKSIIESSSDLIMLTAPDGLLQYASPASVDVTGYAPEECIGTFFWPVHPVDDSSCRAIFERAIAGERGKDFQYRILDKVGETRWVSHSWSPVMEGSEVRMIVSVVRDITERIRNEEALRDSEERYRRIVENSSDLIMLSAPDGQLAYASPASVAITGYEPEELVTERPWFVHPEDSDRMYARFTQPSEKGSRSQADYRILTKTGETRWVTHSWSPVFEGDSLQTVVSVIKDVTEQRISDEALRQAQEALRKSEEEFRSIVENSTDLILLATTDGVNTYASPAARDVTGYQPEELIADKPWIVHPDDTDRILAAFELAQLGVSRSNVEYRIVTKSGETRSVLHSWSPIMDGDRIRLVLSIIKDVTELVGSQMALRESEARYRGIVQNSSDLIMLTTSEGKIAYASPSSREINGYEPDELVSENPWTVHPEDTERMRALFLLARQGESCPGVDYRIVTKTGETRWVSHSWSPIMDGERVQTVVSVIRDITGHKSSTERLRKAHEELEKAYELQTEFLNNVTHEVRTPLTAVQGYTQMLLEGIAGPVAEEQAALLQKVMNSSENLLDVLNAVLQIARMKSGRIDIRPRISDPRLIVQKCISAVLPQAQRKHLTISVKPDPDGVVASYDEEKLTIIITNLLGNAVKFTHTGAIDIAVAARQTGCEIIISDQGVGIDESALEGIFDEFSQLDYPGKHKPAGFGLGLAIVATMVDAIDASLTVSTQSGLGTAFTLSAPALYA